MERITYNRFVRLLTNQAYFVWNDDVLIDQKEEENLEFDIADYKNVAETSVSEVQAKSFYLIEKAFEEQVTRRFLNSYFIREKSIDKKIQKTKWALENEHIDYIVNPVFSFFYQDYQVLAQPAYFSKKAMKMGFLKISTSTKMKDILRFFFDYQVLNELNFTIEDVELYVLKTKDYKKGEVAFYKTKFINTTKNCRSVAGASTKSYHQKQLLKTGQSVNRAGNRVEARSIVEILKMNTVGKGANFYKFKALKTYLDQIIVAKSATKILPPSVRDAYHFENSPNWDFVLEKTKNKWFGYSGNLVNKQSIINNFHDSIIFNKSPILKEIQKGKIIISNRDTVNLVLQELAKKVVWYDFESISLPFAPMNHLLPFNQLITQVSVIKTNHLTEEEISNVIIDPKSIKANDFVKLINVIYKKGYNYVVYNKAYENTRLREMVEILELEGHKKAESMNKKVLEIISNTIDLADFFVCSSKKSPLVLIPFLKGKYSIKILEKYISQANLQLPYQIKEYKSLEVQNGLKAMEIANNRALGIIGDSQWNEITKSLKAYCENDVRAMIMVYHLVKKLLQDY